MSVTELSARDHSSWKHANLVSSDQSNLLINGSAPMTTTNEFYAALTPLYHLIYPNWEASMKRQGEMLNSVIREMWGHVPTVLDVSCGIGTQAIGLAALGYTVTASDLSPEEVERAKHEAAARDISIRFSVSDMRQAHEHHAAQFDVVISCDNAIPHLLSDEDILAAFRQFHACTRPGGGCIITVRDYEKEDLSTRQVKPCGIREESGTRWLLWQVWDPHLPTYDITMYFVEDSGGLECKTHVMRSTYYAVGIPRLMVLLTEAGFTEVRRLDGRFFQPMIIGTKKAQAGCTEPRGSAPASNREPVARGR
jgi:SAM-dependent methyltransferase